MLNFPFEKWIDEKNGAIKILIGSLLIAVSVLWYTTRDTEGDKDSYRDKCDAEKDALRKEFLIELKEERGRTLDEKEKRIADKDAYLADLKRVDSTTRAKEALANKSFKRLDVKAGRNKRAIDQTIKEAIQID